jgi:thioredoxin reductase (NADPH)
VDRATLEAADRWQIVPTPKELALDGLFIEIGMIPNGVLLKEVGAEIDAGGHIVIDAGGKTNVPGLYAAGDVSSGSNGIRQILSASAEGMIGVSSIYNYLKTK